jgi:hypothetical protein
LLIAYTISLKMREDVQKGEEQRRILTSLILCRILS